MSLVMQILKNLRLLQPQQLHCQTVMKCSDKLREAGRAKENVHFLKMQRDQLKCLRLKILKERELIKKRIMELDEEIESIKKKNSERRNNKYPKEDKDEN